MSLDELVRLLSGILIAAAVLGGLIWAVRPRPFTWRRRIPVELKQALMTVLAAGYGVERKGVHLYPKGSGRYAVLKFDASGDVAQGEHELDEVHSDLGRAVDRHFEASGGFPPEVVETAWGKVHI
jgi:hypothetical protein